MANLLALEVVVTSVAYSVTLDSKAGGAEGSRTPDLLIANETLCQLSYDPDQFAMKII